MHARTRLPILATPGMDPRFTRLRFHSQDPANGTPGVPAGGAPAGGAPAGGTPAGGTPAGGAPAGGAPAPTPAPGTGAPAGGTPPAADLPKPAGVSDEAWAALGDPGKRALVAEREAREQAVASAAALQKQIDDASKTAEEKAAEALAEAQQRASAAETRAAKYDAAANAGLPLELAPRLVGSTPEELAADAVSLKAQLGATPAGTPKPGNPRPDPSQGGGAGTEHDPREAGKAEARRRFGKTE
jgi:hypothetical protein